MRISRRQALSTTWWAGCWAASMLAVPRIVRPAGSARPINIVMTQGMSGLAVHEIARAQGFFAEFDVEPKVLQVSDGAKCVAALISGSAEICIWSGFNQLTPAIERGAQLKILAGALNLPSLAMYTGRPEVKTVSDLKGKVIGIGSLGSVLHQMTGVLLKKKGVDLGEVKFRNVGSNAEVLKAVSAKTVDAGLSDVEVFDEQKKFGVRALPDGLLWREIPEYTNQATYASDEAIRRNRATLIRVLAAYAKAYRYVSSPESKDAFLKARRKLTGQSDPTQSLSQWNWIQENQPYATNLVLTDEQLNFVQRTNVEFKIQRTVLPIAKIADMSLARSALEMLS